ncbi:FKBP12-associated protein [Ceratobasidium sp. UAMH 11750]|nr:FKBP12-associated protein [Ceratobasidium sp. UAMH 11750]
MSAVPVDRGPPPNAGQDPPGQPSRSRNRRGRGRGQAPPRPEDTHEGTQVASTPPNGGAPNRRRNRGGQRQGRPTPSNGNPEHQLPPHLAVDTPDDGASVAESTGSNTRRRRGRGGRARGAPTAHSQPPRGGRRENFGARLTDGGGRAGSTADAPIPAPPPTTGDLTSRLIYSLTHREDAVDCPICFNPVHPTQPIWSCAPPPVDPLEDTSAAPATCCWTIFHIRCIKQWAQKSVVATREAYRARSVDLPGDWRCPGCQTKRTVIPQAYLCFCARMADPPPSRLATPHSCGEPCARVRKECEHACPMACHPGPCPPCLVSVSKSCWCGAKTLVSRCSVLNKGTATNAGVGPVLSCGQPCGRLLGCEKHTCELECHPGPCSPCAIVDTAKCYCGKQQKEMACGTGVFKDCAVEGEESWTGRWQCDRICERPFDCGQHMCQKPCHAPSTTPAPCPFSPAFITTCPCTKTPLSAPRNACTDPIPTCSQPCSRPYLTCAHACTKLCHVGACPPCTLPVAVKCRCGETTTRIPCNEAAEGREILCQRACKALRGCGRHVCNRICCPLAGTASKPKGKRRAVEPGAITESTEDDPEGWHVCDLVCNKRLACGNHNCMLPDHRGPCPRCLQSSFEDLICPCNRTIIEPPIPCGTRINCAYPCAQPPPPCGHPRTPHTCHAADEDSSCPPCPHLTNRTCDCGKSTVRNVRCSQERVSCGAACGKLLDCGYHACDRTCHTGECGSCEQVCGKPRKECGHPCPIGCHAPSACPSTDTEPCPVVITVSCPCGRITQPAPCGASRVLKCQDACSVAKRNARLADALGISENTRAGSVNSVAWSPELIGFCRISANQAFVRNVEKALTDFVGSDKKAHVLPHMPEVRRKFVMEVAEVYRVNTQLVDEEPRRSVQLIRRPDSRIPTPTLSQASAPAPSRLGSLGDLRKPTVTRPGPSTGANMGAWRSANSSPAPSSANPNPNSVAPGNLVLGRGSPMSGNALSGSSVTPWTRSSAASIARGGPATTSTGPRPISQSVAARNASGEREDVPASWEDE